MVEVSENQEALIVLVESIFAAVTGFIAAMPLNFEWKAPILGLTGTIAAAIFVYWRARVNIPTPPPV